MIIKDFYTVAIAIVYGAVAHFARAPIVTPTTIGGDELKSHTPF